MIRDKSKFLTPDFFKVAVVLILLLRLILNAVVPVMDKTEARYSEIARIMAETNNWITPQIDYGVPFWAKPPMSTWISAASITIFGENEFAARFPSLLIAIAVVLLISRYVPKHLPKFLAAFVLLTLPEFLLHAGVVSTDMSLLICIVLMMFSFWETMNNGRRYWRYLFFVGIGFGFLAKGPIILLLTFPIFVLWTVIFKKYRSFFLKIPWIFGAVIVIAIAGPWYYFAERATPGFLDYFFVGEHIKRYSDPNWKGDKYGFPKIQPLGIIWVFLFAFALPWILVVVHQLWKDRRSILKNKWLCFLLLWAVWTPFFFTFSKSLIHTYTLPVMPALALLVVHYWEKFNTSMVVKSALILPSIAAGILVASLFTNVFEKIGNTDKFLMESTKHNPLPVYALDEKSYSSQFYTKGKIEVVQRSQVEEKLRSKEKFFLLTYKDKFDAMPQLVRENFRTVKESKKKLLLQPK